MSTSFQPVITAATRAALALVSSISYAAGCRANVADLGDGQPVVFMLTQDARAADGVLRVAALNKAGYLWVAGDGVTLARQYLSAKIDFMTPATNISWFGGSTGGADLLFETQQSTRIIVTDFSATAGSPVVTTMTWNSGNDAAKINLSPSQAVPTAASWNAMILSGVAAPMYNSANNNASSLKPLSVAFKIDITVAVAGTNLTTMKGKFLASGFIFAATTAT
jgi:hypothetical protein